MVISCLAICRPKEAIVYYVLQMLQEYSETIIEIKFTIFDITILISFRLRFSHNFFYVLHFDIFYHLSGNNEMRRL